MISTSAAYQTYLQREQELNESIQILDRVIDCVGENLEGNSFYHGNCRLTSWFFVFKRVNFVNVLLDNQVKKMIEIGFNGGHSAAVFLTALPTDGSLLLFDLNDHAYATPCYEALKQKYSQVKEFIAGDSRETMKDFLTQHPEEIGTFDCIHVDGGHSDDIARMDVLHSDVLLKKGGILILDDTQLNCIENLIPMLLNKGYVFLYQIPTYGFSHVCMMKS